LLDAVLLVGVALRLGGGGLFLRLRGTGESQRECEG
jgi:hypothetical protein